MQHDETPSTSSPVDRRTLLRRGSALLAGVAGASVAGAAVAPSAQAAAGDPVLLAPTNDAGENVTGITSSASTATLDLANTGLGATLRLQPSYLTDPAGVPIGGLYAFGDAEYSELVYQRSPGEFGYDFVATGTVPVPVDPVRVLDTRTQAGRASIVSGSANIDSNGRLIGGRFVVVSLADVIPYAEAILGNLTATRPVGAGHLILWGAGPRPETSSLNFVAGQAVANAFYVGNGYDADFATPELRIYASQTAAVILDVTGVQTLPFFLSAAAGPTGTDRQLAQRRERAVERYRAEHQR